ncbi:hypothetical protein CLOM_g3183 [Closterium sp. NIES-68]|nr:hypothetical protein CLOM_g3183 [Closterium sp. NIES-68]
MEGDPAPASSGPAASSAPIYAFIQRANRLLTRVESRPASKLSAECRRRIVKLITRERRFLSSLLAHPFPATGPLEQPAAQKARRGSRWVSNRLQSSNLPHMETIVAALCHPLVSQASAAMTHFPTAAAPASRKLTHQHQHPNPTTISDSAIKSDPTVHIDPTVHVDLVCLFNGLPTWLLATARNPNRIGYQDTVSAPVSATWERNQVPPAFRSSDRGIRRRILSAQSAAATCPPAARPEAVVVVFGRGVRDSVGAMVERDMGGERVVGGRELVRESWVNGPGGVRLGGLVDGEVGGESVGRVAEESMGEGEGVMHAEGRSTAMESKAMDPDRMEEEEREEGAAGWAKGGGAMVGDEQGCVEGVGEDEMADSWAETEEEEEYEDEDDFRVLADSEGQRRWWERRGGGGGGEEWVGSVSMQCDGGTEIPNGAEMSFGADVARGVWFRISTRALPAHVVKLLGCAHTQPSGVAPHVQSPSETPEETPEKTPEKTPGETPEEMPDGRKLCPRSEWSEGRAMKLDVRADVIKLEATEVIHSNEAAAGVINLDVTAAVALVSELTHGGAQRIAGSAEPELRARFGNTWQFMREQAQSELAHPQLQVLQGVLHNKDVIMCQTAYNEYTSIVDVIAGPREKQRAAALLTSCVRVVPDQPSSRLLSLPSTARIKQRHIIIFGTSDSWGCATLSASTAFVRAARHAGALVRVVEHRPSALMGE